MGKRKIKLLMLGLMDRIEQINAILVEKNKYKNKKRIDNERKKNYIDNGVI